jgi:hypothetical protein
LVKPIEGSSTFLPADVSGVVVALFTAELLLNLYAQGQIVNMFGDWWFRYFMEIVLVI